jgi:MarR family transcriptional regulator, organic hydroperoxide resistance regulator
LPSEGGSLVSQLHQLSGRVFSRVLKRQGLSDINPAQGRILYALWKEDGLSQVELARRTKLDKSTLALMLDRLEERGQLRREGEAGDSRIKRIRLSQENKALHAAYVAASEEMSEIFYAGFTPREIEEFESKLRRLILNLEKAEDEGRG